MFALLPQLLLLAPCLGLSPGDTLPSCMHAGITWDPSTITSIVNGVQTPEECQQLCQADPSCTAVTWSTEATELFPLSCAFFPSTANLTEPCSHCVSGPPACACTVPGECQIVDENIIEVTTGVDSVGECEALCIDHPECQAFTFLGEGNDFRHTCYLFRDCEVFSTDCTDCTSGLTQCNVCDFLETQDDGSCGAKCEVGWSSFEDSCYMLLNNTEQHYDDIAVCRAECEGMGGQLASIHSPQENAFIYSILRPPSPPQARSGFWEQTTWVGARKVGGEHHDSVFEWEDGTGWNYTNWYNQGEPDGSGDCIYMGMSLEAPDSWSDGDCGNGEGYFYWDCICKK